MTLEMYKVEEGKDTQEGAPVSEESKEILSGFEQTKEKLLTSFEASRAAALKDAELWGQAIDLLKSAETIQAYNDAITWAEVEIASADDYARLMKEAGEEIEQARMAQAA